MEGQRENHGGIGKNLGKGKSVIIASQKFKFIIKLPKTW